MQKRSFLELPFPSTSAISAPVLFTSAGDLLLLMDIDDDGLNRPVCLRFVKQRAFRKRAEAYCTAWHVSGVYDIVCEVLESDWVDELRAAVVSEWRDKWALRHFMLFVDSFGCIEVVADSVVLDSDPTNSGRISSASQTPFSA